MPCGAHPNNTVSTLQTTYYELHTANYTLRSTKYTLQTTHFERNYITNTIIQI